MARRKGKGRRNRFHKLSGAKKQWYVDRLRRKYGDNCWLCQTKMSFDFADRQAKNYRTIDHVVSPNHGGELFDIDNMMLAHQGCNNEAQNGHVDGRSE